MERTQNLHYDLKRKEQSDLSEAMIFGTRYILRETNEYTRIQDVLYILSE